MYMYEKKVKTLIVNNFSNINKIDNQLSPQILCCVLDVNKLVLMLFFISKSNILFLGEGIHHAMEGGKLAAIFLDEALNHGNYDSDVMKIYHHRWMSKFGYDFKW